MKTYLLVFLAATSTVSFSQKPYIVELKNELIKIPKCNFYIDSIIDNRHYKMGMGMIKKGRKDSSYPASFDKGFTSLKTYLAKNIPVNQAKSIPITIVINHFWIWEEVTSMGGYGNFSMDIDFCRKNSSGEFMILSKFTKNIEQKDDDLPNSHEERIRKSFTEALNEFEKINLNIEAKAIIHFTQINTKKNILNFKDLYKGAYISYADFYNNVPNKPSKGIIIKEVEEKKSRFFLQDSVTNIKNSFYAFCDGKDIFINSFAYAQPEYKQFAKVLERGRFILIDDIVPHDFNPSLAAYSFGLAGVLASYAIGSSEKRGILIDTQKGFHCAFTYDNLSIILSEFPELLQKWKDSASYNFKTKRKFINLMNTEIGK